MSEIAITPPSERPASTANEMSCAVVGEANGFSGTQTARRARKAQRTNRVDLERITPLPSEPDLASTRFSGRSDGVSKDDKDVVAVRDDENERPPCLLLVPRENDDTEHEFIYAKAKVNDKTAEAPEDVIDKPTIAETNHDDLKVTGDIIDKPTVPETKNGEPKVPRDIIDKPTVPESEDGEQKMPGDIVDKPESEDGEQRVPGDIVDKPESEDGEQKVLGDIIDKPTVPESEDGEQKVPGDNIDKPTFPERNDGDPKVPEDVIIDKISNPDTDIDEAEEKKKLSDNLVEKEGDTNRSLLRRALRTIVDVFKCKPCRRRSH